MKLVFNFLVARSTLQCEVLDSNKLDLLLKNAVYGLVSLFVKPTFHIGMRVENSILESEHGFVTCENVTAHHNRGAMGQMRITEG